MKRWSRNRILVTLLVLGSPIGALVYLEELKKPKVGDHISTYEENMMWHIPTTLSAIEDSFDVELHSAKPEFLRCIHYKGYFRFPMGKVWVVELDESDRITAIHAGGM